jgi:DNA-directed RNA polymerase
LEEFTKEVVQVLDEDKKQGLPELPKLGSLDVSRVLEAEFFFA